MSSGIITQQGRVFKATLWHDNGPFYCGVGQGDASFTNPTNPPLEDAAQTGLKAEQVRHFYTLRQYLTVDPAGPIQFGGRAFSESLTPSAIVLFTWHFDSNEANFIWKEYGFFGGTVTYGKLYNGAAPPGPSGIGGVTVQFVSNNNGVGTASMVYTASGTRLQWRSPGSSNYGPQINVGTGGNFTLVDGDDPTRYVRVAVAVGSLPGSNLTVSPTLSNAGNVGSGGINTPSNPTGQIDASGYLVFVRNIPDQLKTTSVERFVRLLIEP